jgi:hypothetical protein
VRKFFSVSGTDFVSIFRVLLLGAEFFFFFFFFVGFGLLWEQS